MSYSTNIVRAELEALGYETFEFDAVERRVVCFDYIIETGSYKGEQVTIGVSFEGSGYGGYPEYPPHWIHITPPISDNLGGAIERYKDAEGRQWIAMSRPPGDIWDKLPTKHMKTYISEHLRRIWKDV